MKSLVHLGWILAADVRDPELLTIYEGVCEKLRHNLEDQFPKFEWQVEFLQRRRFAPRGAIDPLALLEFGVQEKIAHRWDYALVVVTNDLKPRERVHTIGIPSSALETAVLSSASLGSREQLQERLVGLALHLLGHLWGIEHEEHGPMVPPEEMIHLRVMPYPEDQQIIIADRLDEVADKRLEEQSRQWNSVHFYWRAFWADPKSILIDVFGYAPWRLPFQMGRLTAATAVSLLVLFLTAEAWEVGVNLHVSILIAGSILANLVAAAFIFTGQNLGQISREVGWREQLTRTRIVIFSTLLLGILFLWAILFVGSFIVGMLMPLDVLEKWVDVGDFSQLMLARHAAFMAILGVLAGALGGNLEDEGDIKASLLYDEET